jgi:PKD domain/Galactose oxidase, central domain
VNRPRATRRPFVTWVGLTFTIVALLVVGAWPGMSGGPPRPPSAPFSTSTGEPGPAFVRSAPVGPRTVFPPAEWANLTAFEPVSPRARGNPGIAYDAADGYVVLFGGLNTAVGALGDTWILRNGTWSNISSTAGTPPAARFDASMAYDAANGYVVLFGGESASGFFLNDTWEFQAGRWSQLSPSGPVPAERYEAGMTYDAAARELVLFGGSDSSTYFNDTWTFSSGNWTKLSVQGSHAPPSRRLAAFSYDAADNVSVLFGGVTASFTGFNDTWTFANRTWTELNESGRPVPTARWVVYSVYDPELGGDLLMGGCVNQGCHSTLDDTWVFADGNWTELTGLVRAPSDRGANPEVYEPVGLSGGPDVVFFGGSDTNGSLGDTWAFSSAIYSTLDASPSRTDAGGSIDLSSMTAGGTRPLTYSWGGLPPGCPGANASTLSCVPDEPGNYSVWLNVTDPTGASSNRSVNLTVFPGLEVGLGASRTTLEVGQSITFTLTASGGVPPYAYAYQGLPAGCVSANVTALTCVVNAAGTFTVQGRVSDQVSTNHSEALLLTIDGRLGGIAAVSPASGDAGQTFWMNASATGGRAPFNFSWSGAPCAALYGAVVECRPVRSGTFAPSVLVTDADGGVVNLSAGIWVVAADPTIRLDPAAPVSVAGSPITFTATVENGTAPFSYYWTFGDGGSLTGTANVVDHTFLTTGNYSVSVTVTDLHGVSATSSGTATVVRALAVGLSASAAFVTVTGSLRLSAVAVGGEPPYVATWSSLPPGCFNSPALTLDCDPNAPGSFSVHVTVTDAAGEAATSSASVGVNSAALVAITGVPSGECAPEPVTLVAQVEHGGTAPFAYRWEFGDGTVGRGSSVAHTFAQPGAYWVNVTAVDSSNVSAGASVNVTVSPAAACAPPPSTGALGILPWAIGAVVLVAVVLVALVLVRRRRPPAVAPDPDGVPEPPEPYG